MCVKDGNIQENKGIVEKAKEYEREAQATSDQLSQEIASGNLTPGDAKQVAMQKYISDPAAFQNAIQQIENASGSNRTITSVQQSINPIGNGRSISLQYSDGTQENFVMTYGPQGFFFQIDVGPHKGFQISSYENPFDNPDNVVEQWITEKGPDKGKINQKIVSGPDQGIHRFTTPYGRTGQTGITRFSKGGKVEKR